MARRKPLNWFDKLFLGFLGVMFVVVILGSFIGTLVQGFKETAALEFHEKFESVVEPYFTDGTMVTGGKAVCLEAGEGKEDEAVYTKDHVPEGWLAEEPEEVRYVIRYISGSDIVGFYSGGGAATQKWAQVSVEDLKTGKILGETKIMGGDPPYSITVKSGEYRGASGTAPSEEEVLEWLLNTLEGKSAKDLAKAEQSIIHQTELTETTQTQETTEQEVPERYDEALKTAKELLEYLHLGPDSLKSWLVEFEEYTQEEAAYAVENCGADWQKQALLSAKSTVEGDYPSGPLWIKESLVNYDGFTAAQAEYAIENCGADWGQEALEVAKGFLESKMGYSHSGMVLVLVGDHGFTQEQAENAAANCGADWNQVAVDHVELFMEYSEEPYTRELMIREMVEYYGFTEEQAIYAVDKVGLK